jgi:hypothetical protein
VIAKINTMASFDRLLNRNDQSLPRLQRALSIRAPLLSLKKSIPTDLDTTLNIAITFILPPVLAVFSLWKYVDLIIRISLAEVNRSANEKRLTTRIKTVGAGDDASRTVASIVGYREDLEGYERALRSLAQSGAAVVIAGVDGNSEEDVTMTNVCNKVRDYQHVLQYGD